MRRRDVLAGTLASSSLALLNACRDAAQVRAPSAPPATAEASVTRRLAEIALGAARDAGATYADVRFADYRTQSVATREHRVEGIFDDEDAGFGVRVIVDGTWGFAASPRTDAQEVAAVARQAVAMARANAKLQKEPVVLAPVGRYDTVWSTPIRRDAFDVSLAEKVDRLLSINAVAMKCNGVDFVTSRMSFVREHKIFASSEGSYIEQTLHRLNPSFTVTSIDRRHNGFQTRNSYAVPMGMGYEYVEDYPWEDDVRQAASDVLGKHKAPSVETGPRDLILHPSNLWLTIHESIGHPTELDRALGMEANYAGTSFLTPDKRGHFRIGSDIVDFEAEKTAAGSLATCGYDDDGAKTLAWPLVTDGVFVDYQTTRDQAHWLGHERGFACSYAQSWKDVPFQRMPNINLRPGKTPLSLEQLISSTDDAILIQGTGSWSIDHQRYNFQFSGQTFWHVKSGKIAGMLKDVAYQSRSAEFWAACDAICSEDEYFVGGSFYDGKGEPSQSNAVSHGCCPARFRQIHVLNTARKV